MDTQVSPTASAEPLGDRELLISVGEAQASAECHAARVKVSDDSLRRVRIALAEYARTSGMYDPLDVVVFTKLCIREAVARVKSKPAESNDALLREALRIAAASCGACHVELADQTPDMAVTVDDADEAGRSAGAPGVAARIARRDPIVPVPASHGRSMPPQSLGELPDVRPARLLNSLMQLMWRPVGTLLTAMFARSE